MNIENFCRHLAKRLHGVPAERQTEIACQEIAGFFAVREHEIGLFQVNPVARMAILRSPHSVGNAASIPLQTIASSLIASTIREQRGFIDNNFATTPHLYMVERTLAEPEQRVPVQKIMSVPVIVGGEVLWVIQVTRKGRIQDEAGSDFTENDLGHLERMAESLAGLL